MEVRVHYLYHSGFAVDTGCHFLIFDYWKDTPWNAGLEEGVIRPRELAEKDVIAFVSHQHGDHFNRKVLGWGKEIPQYRLILSDDIMPQPGARMIGSNQTLEEADFVLRTLASTDEGVAFLLEIDGLRIYHAGDLNWWHWQGETQAYNRDMAERYREQIALIAKEPIDLAFVPVDPRLGDQYAWGLDHLMRAAEVHSAIPMHFGDDVDTIDRLMIDPMTQQYRHRILPLTRRGQSTVLAVNGKEE